MLLSKNLKTLVFIFALASLSFGQAKNKFDYDAQLGVVDVNSNDKKVCLAINNANLKENDKVRVILMSNEKRQIAVTGVVKEKLTQSCSNKISTAEEFSAFYLLKPINNFTPDVGIAFINPANSLVKTKRSVQIDLDKDGKNESFRSCTSMEGVHLTVWSGRPLTGRRVWHKYYYLGYDTVPTCTKKESSDLTASK